ncbi:MAG: thiamine pyrophosphate-binding protein, partial [Mesorhizobium sp.]|nr:thiamine pyrophosphate-binding protein [Mesorhizobium sp.]
MHTDNKPQKNDRMDGGGAIVAWLKNAGVKNVFSVSGGPINAVYRACANQGLALIHARHEAAACFMAEAQSRVTGKAGAAVVTLGPGVTNAVTPSLVATLAGTPIIIVGAKAGTKSDERGAGMAYDVLPIMKNVTKWAARCTDPNRLQEYLDIAWRKMWAGRPGPVFLEVPSDILSTPLASEAVGTCPPLPGTPGVSASDADAAIKLLGNSKKPLLILGDELFWHRSERLVETIEKHNLAFATMRLARGIVSELHPNWVGPAYIPCNATLKQALADADCVVVLGHHFEFDLEFGDSVGAGARIIQVCSDQELLHRNKRADIAVNASPAAFLELLAGLPASKADGKWTAGLVDAWNKERAAQLGQGDAAGIHPI